ncbi:glycosyltransferase [Micrococcus sp. HG099]|uniref:glycosyltransferase n=1 Tax=Micrococcus sp. HG099 TaxID=2969755 RepID=UPI00215B1D3B|nr:glycosyltransferase [Micrococcus sp. HG099]MCR8675053.1 glycosyltransferase [Micrococcus sp. HG099]
MRISVLTHMLHPIRSPYAGGLEMHTAMTVEHLVRRGHEVTVYAREGTRLPADVVPVLPAEGAGPGKEGDRLREEATRRACEMVLADGSDAVLNNSLSPAPLQLLRERPMVTVLHTPATLAEVLAVVDHPDWRAPQHHRWACVSASNALAWQHRLPRVDVVPNGIELHHWVSDAAPVPGRAVWSGRITAEKGLHVAIDAARLAGMELHFAGPISDEAYYAQEIVPRLGPDTVHHGHLDHATLPHMLATGEVFLATPMWAEPFGLATVEAMALGVPVAALLSGAMGEIVAPQAGSLAVHHSAEALAVSIRHARRKDRGRVRAWACRFSAETMVEGYVDLLEQAAEDARDGELV